MCLLFSVKDGTYYLPCVLFGHKNVIKSLQKTISNLKNSGKTIQKTSKCSNGNTEKQKSII